MPALFSFTTCTGTWATLLGVDLTLLCEEDLSINVPLSE